MIYNVKLRDWKKGEITEWKQAVELTSPELQSVLDILVRDPSLDGLTVIAAEIRMELRVQVVVGKVSP